MAGEVVDTYWHGLLGTKADQVTANPNIGQIAATLITAVGSGGTNGTYTLGISGGGGSGATGTYTIASNKLSSISITNPGSGFTSAPTLSFPSGGLAGAAASAFINYPVVTPEFGAPALFPAMMLTFYGGNATIKTAFVGLLVASGGNPPYSYVILSGSLPPGLTLNGSTGVVSGMPTSLGSYTFTAQATDLFGAIATCVATVVVGTSGGNYVY